ncbi:ABC transporter ATP-binding protein [Tengunoibacter tsumagoiensis]|uniref:Helicase n=1 Tax=Tengunoibacter tsumagoiensis TaxID=2014871 RepID=A0A402A747_9CHLR|nr:ABC transporter ATP-binding protein [Tengunoibacter tsumagoiensis]GCE14962.1 helicase [Tengunoibacter tsumagoiensis]
MPKLQSFTQYIRLLARYLKPQWRVTLVMVMLMFLSIVLQLLSPQALRAFIDVTLRGGITGILVLIALLYLALSLLNQGVTVIANYLSEKVAWTATNQLRIDLMAHILSLDLSFYYSHTAGELIERIDSDVDQLSNFFSKVFVQMGFYLALLVGTLIALALTNRLLGLIMGCYALMVLLVVMWLRRPVGAQQMKWREADARFFGALSEQLVGVEDLRANGAVGYVMHRFIQLYNYWFTTIKKAGLTGARPWILSQMMYTLGGILGLVLGAYLWAIGLATPGTVYLIFTYSTLLTQPLGQIILQLQDLQQAQVCIQRVQELLSRVSTIQDGEESVTLRAAPAITFEQVCFGYQKNELVIQDLSFVLPAGRVLGILGRTGAGKSTIARLLFRLFDPDSGVIRLDDRTLPQMRLRDLRKQIGMITQEVQLFEGSVRDNLTFFNREIPDDHILHALHESGLAQWYARLPEGLDTQLSAGGAGLSAGEAQLLAFARVFLNDPKVVILDEASSRLDPATEQTVKRAMEKLFCQRTGIIIAHRLTTIEWVNDIIVLEKGRIVEYGSRSDLANDPDSHFSGLLQHTVEVMNA